MKFKKALSLALVLSLVMTLAVPVGTPAFAAGNPGSFIFDISEGNITVAAGSGSDIRVTYGASQETTADFANTQEITITGSSTEHTVVVNTPGNTANITLDNADMEYDRTRVYTHYADCPFSIENGTAVSLTLKGANILTSLDGNPGLRVAATGALTIGGTGSLYAEGGAFDAGIGGGNFGNCGTVIINGGSVTAVGGGCGSYGGAGIGGGNSGSGGTVTVNDGTVIATGGTGAAGIGGGTSGSGGEITIKGGTVTATGGSFNGSSGAGIGGGTSGSGGLISVDSGTVTAAGGDYAAGIGGGTSGSGGTVTVSGGTVTAAGGIYAAGIGGGNTGDAADIGISAAAAVTAVSDGHSPAIHALGGDLKTGSTACVLMANFSAVQNSSTTTAVRLKADASLKASDTPDLEYQSIAFTVPGADTYVLETDSLEQQHDSGETDFVIAGAGLTVFNSVTISDAAAVAADKAALTDSAIKGTNADLDHITANLTLPTTGANGSAITWASDTAAVVSNDGNTIVRPVYGDGDATVILTATITKGSVSDTKTFTVTVSEAPEASFSIADGNITVTAGTSAGTLKVQCGTRTLDNIPATQKITVTGSSNTNKVIVNISSRTANMILSDADIAFTAGDSCAFSIDSGTVNLTLEGANTLKSSSGNAGLRVAAGTTLTVQGTGSLTAADGASDAAGIGGSNGAVNGTIIINSGTVTATGGCTGIGSGCAAFAAGGAITINGGTVTATGSNGAGIGSGGAFVACGAIAITGGTVTATGSNGAGIGCGGSFGTPGTVTISEDAAVIAVSDGTLPAIAAAEGALGEGSTACVLMADFDTARSGGAATAVYLKSDSSLKASCSPAVGYQSIAFTVSAAGTYQLKTDDELQKFGDDWNTDFTISGAGLTAFEAVSDYYLSFTVTVKKDGEAWTSGAPDIKLSTAAGALTDAVSGTCTDGVCTFTGLDPSRTCYVWDTSNDQYTGQSVSHARLSAEVDYYTVALTKGTGIDSASGSGVYLSGSDVQIGAGVADGYRWTGWTLTSDGSEVSATQIYTITNISGSKNFTANAKLIYIGDGTYWTDGGNYDTALYEALISSDFDETAVNISTPRELAALARAQDVDGIDFTDVTFELTEDIDLDGCLWDPIGLADGDTMHEAADGSAHPFRGNFDGNGHVISNMTVEGVYIAAGLFGDVNDSNLDDFDLSDMRLISNITVGGTIDVTGAACVGGVAGSAGKLILTDCINRTAVTGTNDTVIGGGILGFGMCVVLDGCFNQAGADISVAAASAEAYGMSTGAGGIAGAVFLGSIYDSANFASVTVSSAGDQPIAGGILGMGLSGTVGNCYNTGAVTAGGSNSLAGGICGYDMDMSAAEEPYIRNCYNTGAVTAATAAGIAASVNAADSCYYLSGTAPYAYYDADNNPAAGTGMSDTDMQSDDFCQALNDWVADNPASGGLTEAYLGMDGIGFEGWVRQDGVNSGYPIFESDLRYANALTVNLNGGSGATAGGSYALGASVSIDAGAKSGYTFSGWTSSDGGAFGDAGSAATTFAMPGNATTITANWTRNDTGDSGYAPNAGNTTVTIDGTDYAIGHESKKDASTTATVDQSRLTDGVAKASEGSGVLFPITANDEVTARLVLQNIEDMAQKAITLTVQTGNISYNLDTTAIDTEAVMEALGTADAENIAFSIGIGNSSAAVNGATLVVLPVEFTITCTHNGQSVTVDTFSSFVSRSVEVTAEQAAQITTAVVAEPDGSLRQVPTKVIRETDGSGTLHYYAVINSLTNSSYALIQNTVEFADAAGWAKDAINDMGSRMVVLGVGDNRFDPDRDITRGEFAAITVRALGLAAGIGESAFRDVVSGDWCCGYIETAVSYGLITGYGDGTFGPDDRITREEAMTIIARAMVITELSTDLTEKQIAGLLTAFADGGEASGWAVAGIAACLETGVVNGRTSLLLCPKENITRAEVAVIVQRLLVKSGLIDQP